VASSFFGGSWRKGDRILIFSDPWELTLGVVPSEVIFAAIDARSRHD